MESFGSKDIVYIIVLIASVVGTFIGTKYKLKEFIRDKSDHLTKDIHGLQLEMKDLKHRDELQQQVIDQISKQIDGLIPKLFDSLNQKKDGN
jgi:predicted PurR-regulated permease PerM